jgi:hypothetical protein
MINETIYRLGEYRIIEYENGLLWWERLFNFGVQHSGKCFILGDILIIGHWSHEEAGYLQLEFSEQLQKLPVWDKTRYYCFASELLDISTVQSLSNDSLERYITLTSSTGSKSLMNMSPGMFRLGRYQIAVTDQGEVLWQTYEGLHRVVGGQCVIESDVLFIGPQEYDEGNQSKREFLNKLNQLPKWDKSMAWCRSVVLRTCHVEVQQTKNPDSINLHQYIMDEHSFDEKPSALNLNQYKEPSKRLLRLSSKCLETAWHCIRGGKRWLKYLIPLVLVGLLLGLVMILHSLEKKSDSHLAGNRNLKLTVLASS